MKFKDISIKITPKSYRVITNKKISTRIHIWQTNSQWSHIHSQTQKSYQQTYRLYYRLHTYTLVEWRPFLLDGYPKGIATTEKFSERYIRNWFIMPINIVKKSYPLSSSSFIHSITETYQQWKKTCIFGKKLFHAYIHLSCCG